MCVVVYMVLMYYFDDNVEVFWYSDSCAAVFVEHMCNDVVISNNILQLLFSTHHTFCFVRMFLCRAANNIRYTTTATLQCIRIE